jgi:hypothetical protein
MEKARSVYDAGVEFVFTQNRQISTVLFSALPPPCDFESSSFGLSLGSYR